MYKNCYVTRGEEYNHYNIHLWTDEGYSVEQFQNYGYQECSDQQATHRGVKNEPLKKSMNGIDLLQVYIMLTIQEEIYIQNFL